MLEEMMAAANDARIQKLQAQINQARLDYFNGVPTTTDEVFDAWVDELRELQADAPAVTAIGAPVPATSEWPKVRHGIPMGSLDKVNTPEELGVWAVGNGISDIEALFMSEKLDGISIHARYVNGVFTQAITRGDGTTGEDITPNVAKMKGVLAQLPEKFTGSLRGEIILTKQDHAAHFPDKANTRNTAAGTSKRYDGKGCEHLTVLFYRVADGKDFSTEAQQFEWLAHQGFKLPNSCVTVMQSGGATPETIRLDYQEGMRETLNYDIDGLVFSVNSFERQLALGEKDGRPKGAVAFKFAAVARETILRDILWQVGGSGRITPVAVFDPVQLVGAEVTNASLYNMKYIQDLGILVGSRILVARANDVIPRVTQVIEEADGDYDFPEECPSCKAALTVDGEYLVCPNTAGCPAQAMGRIQRYIAALDVKEWGETLIERLVTSGKVKTPADLYQLNIPSLSEVERITETLADKLLGLLWEKNELPLETLLGALSIPLCASSTIRMVMDAGYDTWEKIQGCSEQQFETVPGLGPIKAKALWKWVEEVGRTVVPGMLKAGVKIKAPIQGNLTGFSFCFTGKSVRKRSDLEAIVAEHGGIVKTSVGKGLTYLVMADPASGSTKAKAAAKNGTKCITEDDLLKMVES